MYFVLSFVLWIALFLEKFTPLATKCTPHLQILPLAEEKLALMKTFHHPHHHHHHHCHHLCPVFKYLKMDLHLKTAGLLSWLWTKCLLSIIFFSLQPSSISARNVATAINCKISQNLFYFVCDRVQTRCCSSQNICSRQNKMWKMGDRCNL